MNKDFDEARRTLGQIQPLLDNHNVNLVFYLEPIFCAANCVPEYYRLLGRAHELCKHLGNREFLEYAQKELARLIDKVLYDLRRSANLSELLKL